MRFCQDARILFFIFCLASFLGFVYIFFSMRRPRRSVVRTPGFHPGNGGSIPLGVAINIVYHSKGRDFTTLILLVDESEIRAILENEINESTEWGTTG